MPMSKKHYEAVADAMARVMWTDHMDPATMTAVIWSLSSVFQEDNPRFDKDRFISACTRNILDAK